MIYLQPNNKLLTAQQQTIFKGLGLRIHNKPAENGGYFKKPLLSYYCNCKEEKKLLGSITIGGCLLLLFIRGAGIEAAAHLSQSYEY